MIHEHLRRCQTCSYPMMWQSSEPEDPNAQSNDWFKADRLIDVTEPSSTAHVVKLNESPECTQSKNIDILLGRTKLTCVDFVAIVWYSDWSHWRAVAWALQPFSSSHQTSILGAAPLYVATISPVSILRCTTWPETCMWYTLNVAIGARKQARNSTSNQALNLVAALLFHAYTYCYRVAAGCQKASVAQHYWFDWPSTHAAHTLLTRIQSASFDTWTFVRL